HHVEAKRIAVKVSRLPRVTDEEAHVVDATERNRIGSHARIPVLLVNENAYVAYQTDKTITFRSGSITSKSTASGGIHSLRTVSNRNLPLFSGSTRSKSSIIFEALEMAPISAKCVTQRSANACSASSIQRTVKVMTTLVPIPSAAIC